MNRYLILNQVTKEQVWSDAETKNEAIQKIGWHVDDCALLKAEQLPEEDHEERTHPIHIKVRKLPKNYSITSIHFTDNGISICAESRLHRLMKQDRLTYLARAADRDKHGRFKKQKLLF